MGHDDHYIYLNRFFSIKEIDKKLSKIGKDNVFIKLYKFLTRKNAKI